MRALKIIGGVIAALVLILVLGTVALVLWVDPNDYRDDIARLVEQRTGRPVRIGGPLDFSVYPWLAIEVNDVALGNPPQFGPEPFLTVRSASVGVKLIPLLGRRLEVSRVAVDGLAVTLVSRGEEVNNWQDLGQGEPGEAAPQQQTPAATIEGVSVTDSLLVYRDEAEGTTLRLSRLSAQTGAARTGAPVRAALEFDFDQGEARPLAHLAAAAVVETAPGAARVALRDVNLTGTWFGAPEEHEAAAKQQRAADAPAERSGLPVSVQTPALVLDTQAETLEPAALQVRLAELPLQISLTGEKLFSDRLIRGELQVPQVSPREVLPALGIELPVMRDPTALSRLALAAPFRLTQNALQLSGLDLTLDDTRARGSFAIDDLESLAMSFDLGLDALNVDRYLPPEQPAGAAGAPGGSTAAAAGEPTELPLEALRDLTAKGQLRIGRATFADLQFSDVRLPLTAKNGLVRIGPTRAGLFGGTYNGNIVFDARPARARLSLDERVSGVDIGALLKTAFDSGRVSGRGDARAVLTATGNTDAALFASLAGTLEARVDDGAVEGIDLWYELRRARALWQREPVPARTGPPRTPFETFTGSAQLQNGVLRNDDLRVETELLRARGKGTLDISSGAVDYRLVAEVYKLPEEGAGTEMADLKAAEIPITITGALEDMKIRPDLGALVRDRVRREVQEEIQERTEDIKKKLGDKLKDLLGR